nr:MAG TPA: hypothetical protein [Caudoviricetes sp.]
MYCTVSASKASCCTPTTVNPNLSLSLKAYLEENKSIALFKLSPFSPLKRL